MAARRCDLLSPQVAAEHPGSVPVGSVPLNQVLPPQRLLLVKGRQTAKSNSVSKTQSMLKGGQSWGEVVVRGRGARTQEGGGNPLVVEVSLEPRPEDVGQ